MTIHFQRENVHMEMVGAQKKGKIMSKYLVIEWFPMQLNPSREKEVMFIFKLFENHVEDFLKPRLLIKSGHYIEPSPSTALCKGMVSERTMDYPKIPI